MMVKAHPFTDEQIDTLAEALHMNRVSALLILRSQLTKQKAQDHAAALLDNLPCELCGQVEMSPNHRGIGHTHTPTEDRVPRAALLLNTMPDVPGYIAASARMMLGSRNPGEIVDMDHAEALIEHRRTMAGRRLNAPCQICGGPGVADHSERDHVELSELIEQANRTS